MVEASTNGASIPSFSHCPLRIKSESKFITKQDLYDLGNHDNFTLTFANANNQQFSIFYFPNKDVALPNDSAKSCFFQGLHDNQLSALNICEKDDISGLIPTRTNIFELKEQEGEFILIPKTKDDCNFSSRSKRSNAAKSPEYYEKLADEKIRYLELALFLDNSMYVKYDKDEEKTILRAQAVTNLVNSLYFPFKVRVSLVYVEVWKDKDIFDIATAAEKTLDKFLEYRRQIIKAHPHDNAHLLTNIRFEEGVLGKAYKGTMCSYDYSGGVDVDHSPNAAAVAATLAHEIGHNFGMDHDIMDGSTCSCPGPQCLMAPSLGQVLPTFWSECSVNSIVNSFERGIDVCLENVPEKTLTKAVCGNGVVEGQEECDCGQKECPNTCCDGSKCMLKEGAFCAEGTCCDLTTCKPKPRATVCRPSKSSCDLAEFCNGETSDCPADFYVQNGHVCPEHDKDYCYEGKCGSRTDQCVQIWGADSKSGISQCFDLNRNGNFGGNCGFDFHSGNYTPCPLEDVQCGRLHCTTQSERPIIGTPQTVQPSYTYIRVGREDHMCHVIKTTFSSGKRKERDYGMVTDGATCGKEKMCVDKKCKFRADVNKTVSLCTNDCFQRGVCNNVGNCHCWNGFGGISCEIPGYGGSVNSNTAHFHRGVTPSTIFLFCSFFLILVFLISAVVMAVRERRNILFEFWRWIRRTLKMEGTNVPVRRAPPPPKHSEKKGSPPIKYGQVIYSTRADGNSYRTESISPISPTSPTSTIAYGTSTIFTNPAPVVKLERTKSNRPKVPPPSVPIRPNDEQLNKLYEEEAEHLGLMNQSEIQPEKTKADGTGKKLPPPPLPPKPPKAHK